LHFQYRQKELFAGLALYALLIITVLIYSVGLDGVYLLDDKLNLSALNVDGAGVHNWQTLLAYVFNNESGPSGRPLAMLSFLINDQAFPGDIASFRYTNVLIHCLCGISIFVLVERLFRHWDYSPERRWGMALLVSAWWLLAPINVSTTLYIVQRMTQLSTLFIIIGLIVFLIGKEKLRERSRFGWWLVVIGLYGFGALAVLSKESGAMIFIYALCIEYSLSHLRAESACRKLLILLYCPILLMVGYFCYRWGGIVGTYELRSFSLQERLLTESRVLCSYLYNTVFPSSAGMGLLQDDIQVSTGFFQPLTTFFSLAFHFSAIAIAWVYRRKYPVILLGVAWFYGGHLLESTFLPLELYFEHRNYLPSLGVLISIVAVILHFCGNNKISNACFILLIAVCALLTYQRASIWGKPEWQITIWAKEHPDSIRAQSMYARHLIGLRKYGELKSHLLEQISKNPHVLHFKLIAVNQACHRRIPQIVSASDLMKYPAEEEYHGSLMAVLEYTTERFMSGECLDVSSSDMHRILSGIGQMKYSLYPARAKAEFLDAGVYIKERDLNGAMTALDRSAAFQQNSLVSLVQAELLMSAGLPKAALNHIERAILIEKSKLSFKRSNLPKIDRFKSKIIMALKEGS